MPNAAFDLAEQSPGFRATDSTKPEVELILGQALGKPMDGGNAIGSIDTLGDAKLQVRGE